MLNTFSFTDKSLGADYELTDKDEIIRLCDEYPDKIINNMHLIKHVKNEHQIASNLLKIFESRSVLNYIRIVMSKRSDSSSMDCYFTPVAKLYGLSGVATALRERIDIMNDLFGINHRLDRAIEQELKCMCERQPLVKLLLEYVGKVEHMPKVNV